MEFSSRLKPCMDKLEQWMVSELGKEDAQIYGPIVPFLKRGGKRIRPALAFLSSGLCGGAYDRVMLPAAAIELFHNFTLIHDDIEDDSKFRRGEPTLHIVHGIPIALNSGDALYTFVWQVLSSLDLPPSKLLKLQKLYITAFKRVVDGQGSELSWLRQNRFDITEAQYLDMISGKTSALISLSCEVGAILAGAPKGKCSKLREYGEKLGTAFQIQDDVLNLTGDFDKYKKEIGGDITEGKRTLMVVHCLGKATHADKTRLTDILSSHTKESGAITEAIEIMKKYDSIEYAVQFAKSLAEDAKKLLVKFPDSEDKSELMQLADYVVHREK